MQSAINTLTQMDFDTTSITRMVQQIRDCITNAANPVTRAQSIVRAITSIDVKLPDVETAIPFTQYVAKAAIEEAEELKDHQPLIDRAFERVSELFKKHPWSAPRVESQTAGPVVAVVEGIDVKVEVKADGKIKKGGKQILAAELYKKHVTDAETPVDNQGFIKILMAELGMTKAGATTYRYNLAKQFKK